MGSYLFAPKPKVWRVLENPPPLPSGPETAGSFLLVMVSCGVCWFMLWLGIFTLIKSGAF